MLQGLYLGKRTSYKDCLLNKEYQFHAFYLHLLTFYNLEHQLMFLNIFAYYKMREEGVEEGMTLGGKNFENSDDFFYKMYQLVTAAFVVLLLIANFVTQVQ